MKNPYDFGEPSSGGFIDTHFDFSRCQRPDGSFYGTSGQCRKGTPAGAKEKDAKKGSSSAGGGGGGEVSDAQAKALSKDLTRQIGEAAKKGDQKAVDNLMQAKASVDATIKARKDAVAPAPKKTTSKDPVKSVQKEQQKTKDFLKEDNKRIARENPQVAMRFNKNKIKKLANEYERLRGDAKEGARRRQIMDEVDKLVKQNNALQKRMDDAAKSQSPAKAPDTSPAAQQRRINATLRARD